LQCDLIAEDKLKLVSKKRGKDGVSKKWLWKLSISSRQN
jgi:hypothetical protein